MSPRLRVRWLGRVEYDEAWDLQRAIWEGRTEGRTADDYLLLLEHPHTYTVGRNGDGSNLITLPYSISDNGSGFLDPATGQGAILPTSTAYWLWD